VNERLSLSLAMSINGIDPHKRLLITFEEDLVKSGELGGYPSKRQRSVEAARPETPELSDTLLAEMETISGGSYMSAEFSTIQPLDAHKSLLTLLIQFHPATEHRFINATITWKFRTATGPTSSSPEPIPEPKIVLHAPKKSVGGWSEERKTLVWGISLPVQIGGSSIGLQPSQEKETQKVVSHAMTIQGTMRGKGRYCVWTVEENKSSARGIPSHFQLAVVLEHKGPFVTELDVKAKLGGKTWTRQIRSKAGSNGGAPARTIDIESWRCGGIPEPAKLDWKKFVESMTGEVHGAVVNYEQPIVCP